MDSNKTLLELVKKTLGRGKRYPNWDALLSDYNSVRQLPDATRFLDHTFSECDELFDKIIKDQSLLSGQ